jgi:hypothetical protein
MKRPHKKSRRLRVIRLWKHPEAARAVPYLHSVVRSLRDHWLEIQRLGVTVKRLHEKKADKVNLMAIEDANKEKAAAENKFHEAMRELRKIDVFLLDPVHGVALIPFKKGDDLAWFVFDMFEEPGLVGWRFHQDALETRRPLSEAVEVPAVAATTEPAIVT